MITQAQIEEAVRILAEASGAAQIILFGSYARGTASADSDLDFLVVEDAVVSRRKEMVRLRGALRSLGLPVDVVVAETDVFQRFKTLPGTAYHAAAQEGRVVYDRAG